MSPAWLKLFRGFPQQGNSIQTPLHGPQASSPMSSPPPQLLPSPVTVYQLPTLALWGDGHTRKGILLECNSQGCRRFASPHWCLRGNVWRLSLKYITFVKEIFPDHPDKSNLPCLHQHRSSLTSPYLGFSLNTRLFPTISFLYCSRAHGLSPTKMPFESRCVTEVTHRHVLWCLAALPGSSRDEYQWLLSSMSLLSNGERGLQV